MKRIESENLFTAEVQLILGRLASGATAERTGALYVISHCNRVGTTYYARMSTIPIQSSKFDGCLGSSGPRMVAMHVYLCGIPLHTHHMKATNEATCRLSFLLTSLALLNKQSHTL